MYGQESRYQGWTPPPPPPPPPRCIAYILVKILGENEHANTLNRGRYQDQKQWLASSPRHKLKTQASKNLAAMKKCKIPSCEFLTLMISSKLRCISAITDYTMAKASTPLLHPPLPWPCQPHITIILDPPLHGYVGYLSISV